MSITDSLLGSWFWNWVIETYAHYLFTASNFHSQLIIIEFSHLKSMRGRWASAAIGAGIARRRASEQMDQQASAYEAQAQQAQQQIAAQQRQIEAMQQQQQKQPAQPQQTDFTQQLKKYGDLKQQGLITEEEFQKLKADLLTKIWPAGIQKFLWPRQRIDSAQMRYVWKS